MIVLRKQAEVAKVVGPRARAVHLNEGGSPVRLEGLDAFRLIAFAGVVLIHASEFAFYGPLAGQIGRFAVPFFFVASGYFLSDGDGPRATITKKVTRLLPTYLFWLAFYLILFGRGEEMTVSQEVLFLARGGVGHHLWFLSALGICFAVFAILKPLGWRTVWGVALGAYVFGLAFGSYQVALGLPKIWDTRDGFTFGLIFLVAGAYVKSADVYLKPTVAWSIFAAFMALHLLEQNLVAPPDRRDFFITTLPLGVSAFMASLSWRPSWPAWLRNLSRYTLGMYAVHLAVMIAVAAILPSGQWEWPAIVIVTIVASAAISFLLGQVNGVRRFVT